MLLTILKRRVMAKKYKYTMERIVDDELEKIKSVSMSYIVIQIEKSKTEILKEFYRYVKQRDNE